MEKPLKDYLAKVFELEVAVYTQKRLITEYKKIRENDIPIEPKLCLREKPQSPARLTGTTLQANDFESNKDTRKLIIMALVIFEVAPSAFFSLLFSGNLQKYTTETTTQLEKHTSALHSLEKALAELYDENIIFPKYRELVAVSAINEYLLSGRCETLEGENSAYNLY